MNESSKLLVIGGFSAGKTHFGAQLLSRLQSRTCTFVLREASPSVALLEEALSKLAEGMTSEHTSRDLYGTIILPVINSDHQEIDLIWPEFGGEQVDDFVKRRQVSAEWVARIQEADSWVLMIRLIKMRTEEDLISRPFDILLKQPSEAKDVQQPISLDWSAQAKTIELMQMLLFYKEVSMHREMDSPRLTVLLSCWDELSKPLGTPPREVLHEYMPLFSNFLETNWKAQSLSIYGLSSLSKPLKSDSPDEEYKKNGPESFGYVVLADGSHNRDLTIPISTVVGTVQ
jgi:Double-GTPase 1